MKLPLIAGISLIFAVSCTEGRLKKKIQSEVSVLGQGGDKGLENGPKLYIYDPGSDLCVPLSCKKKELCLLEDLYTAVCVNKKQLHENGNRIVSKAKYLEEESRKKRPGKAGTATPSTTTTTEIPDDFDDEDMDETDEDNMFYDGSLSDVDMNQVKKGLCRECNDAPYPGAVLNPVCGSNNFSYSSMCRLQRHNCLSDLRVKFACFGFCPCKAGKQQKLTLKKETVSQTAAAAAPEIKKSQRRFADKYSLVPEDFKYEDKLYKYLKYEKKNEIMSKGAYLSGDGKYKKKDSKKMENDILEDDEPVQSPYKRQWSKKKECGELALRSMGNRLLDWFSVIKADNRRKPIDYKGKALKLPKNCKSEVGWMFQHLDLNADGKLNLKELYDLEHDENERCIKPFLDLCDLDRDIFVSPYEWCHCFTKADRPCAAIKKRMPDDSNNGLYVPRCDHDGFYQPLQCHAATNACWCVNKHGVESPNSRTRGKVNCDLFPSKLEDKIFEPTDDKKGSAGNDVDDDDDNDSDDDDLDDDDDDDDNGNFGSGDGPLEF